MNRIEVEHVKKVLEKIKDKDAHVERAIAICNKQLAIFNAHRGQLRDNYEDYSWL